MAELDPLQIDRVLRERRTIHEFRPERPPAARILAAIEAARYAPNHLLTEPWRFYLLGEETAAAIADLNAERVRVDKGDAAAEAKRRRWRAIPGWLAVTSLRNADPLREREDYAASCCAVHALMLHLWPDGIGCKWTTGAVTRDPELYELLWIDPQVEQLVSLLWYGYPAEIPRTTRRAVSEITVELP